MKRCLMLMVACVCVLAFAMPALAELKITGAVNTDLYWFQMNEAAAAGGNVQDFYPVLQDQRTEFHINTRRPNNYVQFSYTNDNGTLGGVIRIRGGSGEHSNFSRDEVQFNYQYIWWKPVPNTTITIGQQNQIVGGLGPGLTNLGHQNPTGGLGGPVFINYGNLHSTERAGITLAQKFTKMVGLEVGIYDPEDDNDATPVNQRVAPQQEEDRWPRVDVGIPLKFGNFQTKPKFSYLHKYYDQVVAGSDDNYDIWAASIDARATFGPLRLSAEYSHGQNLSNGNYVGGTGAMNLPVMSYVDAAGNTVFEDSEFDLWWAELKFQMTKALAFYVAYGEGRAKNDVSPTTAADDWRLKSSQVGVMLEYKLFPNFILYPTYARFDNGQNNLRGIGAGRRTDNGVIQVWGVKFQLLW